MATDRRPERPATSIPLPPSNSGRPCCCNHTARMVGYPPAYINSDSGYRWLTCTLCDESLIEADAGTTLADLADAANAHNCPRKAHTNA